MIVYKKKVIESYLGTDIFASRRGVPSMIYSKRSLSSMSYDPCSKLKRSLSSMTYEPSSKLVGNPSLSNKPDGLDILDKFE